MLLWIWDSCTYAERKSSVKSCAWPYHSRIFFGGLLLHDVIQMIDHDETEEPDVISREDVKHLKTCSNIAKQNCDEFTNYCTV